MISDVTNDHENCSTVDLFIFWMLMNLFYPELF